MSFSIDVNDENVGIRHFQIRKEKAVERAVEKIRYKLNDQWNSINSHDIDIFQWALGETWATMSYYDWEHINFSYIYMKTIKMIIILGKKVLAHEVLGTKAFNKIHELLTSIEVPEGEENEL